MFTNFITLKTPLHSVFLVVKYPSKQLIARVKMTKNQMFPLIMRSDLTYYVDVYKSKILDQSQLWNLIYISRPSHEKLCFRSFIQSKLTFEFVHTYFARILCFPTLLDNCNQNTWVYFLKQDSKAFSVFKRFKAMVEKESGEYIKVLRLDKGKEFK